METSASNSCAYRADGSDSYSYNYDESFHLDNALRCVTHDLFAHVFQYLIESFTSLLTALCLSL